MRDGTAANFCCWHTREVPRPYGTEFVVKDRMNARYHRRADIWMAEKLTLLPSAIATRRLRSINTQTPPRAGFWYKALDALR